MVVEVAGHVLENG